MSNDTMQIKVVFPTWDSLSDSVKSLLNFYITYGKFFLNGHYNGSSPHSSLNHISGNVQDVPRAFTSGSSSNRLPYYSLNIPYSNASYPLQIENLLPDVNTTLVRCNTTLHFCYHKWDYDYSLYTLTSANISPLTIPVTLIPLVNGETENEDSSAIPSFLESCNPLRFTYDLVSSSPISYTFQLRTISFTLNTYSYTKYSHTGNGNINYDLYYKVGIVVFGNSYNYDFSESYDGDSLENIITEFKRRFFNISSSNTSASINGIDYSIFGDTYSTETSFGAFDSPTNNYFPNHFILPIKRNSKIYGLFYMLLCYDNGQSFSGIKYTYNDEYIVGINNDAEINVNLSFGDHHIDGGHIDHWDPVPGPEPSGDSGFMEGTLIYSQPGVNLQNHTLSFNMLDQGYYEEYNDIAFATMDCYDRNNVLVWHYEGMLRFNQGYAVTPYQNWDNNDIHGLTPHVYIEPISFRDSTILSDIFVSGTRVTTMPGVDLEDHITFTMLAEGYAQSYTGSAFVEADYYVKDDEDHILFHYEGILDFVDGEAIGPVAPYRREVIGPINPKVYVNPVWSIQS